MVCFVVSCCCCLFGVSLLFVVFLGGGGEGDKNCEEEQAEKHTLKVPSYVTNVIFFSLYKSISKAFMPNTLKL